MQSLNHHALPPSVMQHDPMNVFEFRDSLVADYTAYVTSFIAIRDRRFQERVDGAAVEPSIGLNPSFANGAWVDDLVSQGVLHSPRLRWRSGEAPTATTAAHPAGPAVRLPRGASPRCSSFDGTVILKTRRCCSYSA